MFVFVPMMELGSQLGWAVHPGTVTWRTGAVGILSGAIVTPIFGLYLAILTASLLGHRWTRRLLAALAGLGGLTLIGILGFFALDAVQVRASVIQEMKRPFDLAMMKAIVSFTIGSAALLIISFGVLGADRRSRSSSNAERRTARANRGDAPLVRPRPTE